MLSPAAGNQRWENIFLSLIFFLSSPEHHILKKVHQALPSFPHNTFTVLFISAFTGYLPNCPHPIQFQFCQIHFADSVFTICFLTPFFLAPFKCHFPFHFFLCITNLKIKHRSSAYYFVSGGDFISPFPIPIKIILILSMFWFCQLLFIQIMISENLEMLLCLAGVRSSAFLVVSVLKNS